MTRWTRRFLSYPATHPKTGRALKRLFGQAELEKAAWKELSEANF
ncbi:hypothetical protein [Corynebacterium belfantii]|nr:hypothetical protein [Corynebacterium belfantii]